MQVTIMERSCITISCAPRRVRVEARFEEFSQGLQRRLGNQQTNEVGRIDASGFTPGNVSLPLNADHRRGLGLPPSRTRSAPLLAGFRTRRSVRPNGPGSGGIGQSRGAESLTTPFNSWRQATRDLVLCLTRAKILPAALPRFLSTETASTPLIRRMFSSIARGRPIGSCSITCSIAWRRLEFERVRKK